MSSAPHNISNNLWCVVMTTTSLWGARSAKATKLEPHVIHLSTYTHCSALFPSKKPNQIICPSGITDAALQRGIVDGPAVAKGALRQRKSVCIGTHTW